MAATNHHRLGAPALACALLLTGPAWGGSHLWRYNEIFSNADGSVQFIEMKECCGANNETFIGGKWVKSDVTGSIYTFPANLPCTNCTANKKLLLATQSFADLPGAPTPDFIIPPNFFSLDGDTLRYWMYTPATWTYGDNLVPTDGIHSLNRNGTTGVNSPTNFAGATGSVIVPCGVEDIVVNAAVDVDDLMMVINTWGPCGEPGDCAADFMPADGDGLVDAAELLAVIDAWGSCP